MSLIEESGVGRQHCLLSRSIPTTLKKNTLNLENTKLMNNKRCYFLTLHQRLGHPSKEITRATGLKMKGTIRECEGCGLDKMREECKQRTGPKSEEYWRKNVC